MNIFSLTHFFKKNQYFSKNRFWDDMTICIRGLGTGSSHDKNEYNLLYGNYDSEYFFINYFFVKAEKIRFFKGLNVFLFFLLEEQVGHLTLGQKLIKFFLPQMRRWIFH